MAYPRAYVDELIWRADIVIIIGRRLPLNKKGEDYYCLCPFHQENTASFTVTPVKHFFHCFGCGAHGDAIDFLSCFHEISFIEAVGMLAKEVRFFPKMWAARNRKRNKN